MPRRYVRNFAGEDPAAAIVARFKDHPPTELVELARFDGAHRRQSDRARSRAR